MSGRRMSGRSRMGGLFDFLDIFGPGPGPAPEKKKAGDLPALPAPKGMLPAVRKEERGLIARPARPSIKERLLSIFDVFGPPSAEVQAHLPAPYQAPGSISEPVKKGSLEDLFEPDEGEDIPIFEMLPVSEKVSEIEEEPIRYGRGHPGMPRGSYGEIEAWNFPSVPEMAQHLRRKIDLNQVFSGLEQRRLMAAYEDQLAEAVFNGIPLYTPITVIDDRDFYKDFADFYELPWALVESVSSPEELKMELLDPLGSILTQAFEMLKPEYLPGFFTVDHNSEDGKYWLYYVEPWFGDLPGL